MNFLISANTDVGLIKSTNQDSVTIMRLQTPQGQMVFSVLCDGMGGLQKGEVASASVVRAFREWALHKLPSLCNSPIDDAVIRRQWQRVVEEQDVLIKQYGEKHGVNMGTTVVAMLLTQTRYYILNVGDSRAYELTDSLRRITKDHSVVAHKIARGMITEAEAERDPQRNVLTRCVGAAEDVSVDMFFGTVRQNATYMLCSDGFRHEISQDEIYRKLAPEVLQSEEAMKQNSLDLIELNKYRQERDNISVALVRTV